MAEGLGVSHILNALLDSLGLDEDHRQRRIKCKRMLQILTSWRQESLQNEGRMLLSGSSYETTTIRGLSSDVDIMYIPNDIRVIEDIKDWRSDGVLTYMMDSSECYKAFFRLYLLSTEYPGPEYTNISSVIPPHQIDTSGRLIRTNDPKGTMSVSLLGINQRCRAITASERQKYYGTCFNRCLERQGPAMTLIRNDILPETDFVCALQCESFPRDAFSWKIRQTTLTRTRISPDIIDGINHCYLVGVGDKNSTSPHLEWRLSFSHIENELIHNWNNTQYKCYVMMKFIQKDLINPKVPDVLCSYHYKTIMMWMNEEYPSEFFIAVNFELCVLSCLNNLYETVSRNALPHYFVDGCNLFYPKITNHPDLARKLTIIIRDIISSWPYCLFNIKRCNMGNMIKECLSQPTSLTGICTSVHQKRRTGSTHYELLNEYYGPIAEVRYSLQYTEMSDKSPSEKMHLLLDLKQMSLQQQSDYGSKEFINIVIKDSLCRLGLELRQQSRSMANKNVLKNSKLGERLVEQYSCCGSIETGLKAATDFITIGNCQRGLMVLQRVENQIKHYTQYLCIHVGCARNKQSVKEYLKTSVKEAVYDNKPSFADFFRHYVTGPVIYTQNQMSHVPKGLVYEMFRTTAVSAKSDPYLFYWYPQAVIHCPVYLYYLRFLYHQRQGQDAHRQVALDNMNWAAEEISKSPRTHEETNHNIIGHCHRTVGDTRHAYKEYRKSLEKEKYNNAVIWHLAVLLRGMIRGEQ